MHTHAHTHMHTSRITSTHDNVECVFAWQVITLNVSRFKGEKLCSISQPCADWLWTRSPASPPSARPVSSYTGKLHSITVIASYTACAFVSNISSRPLSACLGEAVEMMSTFWDILCLFWLSWTKSKCFSWLFSTFKGRKNLSAAGGCAFECNGGFKKDHVEKLVNICMVYFTIKWCGHF